jgi:hypothetical protein
LFPDQSGNASADPMPRTGAVHLRIELIKVGITRSDDICLLSGAPFEGTEDASGVAKDAHVASPKLSRFLAAARPPPLAGAARRPDADRRHRANRRRKQSHKTLYRR